MTWLRRLFARLFRRAKPPIETEPGPFRVGVGKIGVTRLGGDDDGA